MVEELLKTFVGVVNTQLFEAIVLKTNVSPSTFARRRTHFENFETGDIEHTDKVLAFCLDIERLIGTFDEPAKHAEVDLKTSIRSRRSSR